MKSPGILSNTLISYIQSRTPLSRWFVALLLALYGMVVVMLPALGDEQAAAPAPLPYGSAGSLARHVRHLAGTIGERHHEQAGSLERAAEYIEQEFRRCRLTTVRETFGNPTAHNLIVEIPGLTLAAEIIVVGAHYDTVWLSPGADDNASGVAAMLEIACLLSGMKPDRTLRFAAFTNEEHPFAETDDMGSRVHVRNLHARGDNIIAMYSLEMVGFYSDVPYSQKYPAPLSWFYPDQASFIAFIGNISSAVLLLKSLRHFREHTDLQVQGLMAPERWLPDIRRSDHASFWDAGIPALMVTDTAFYRNPNYHMIGDQPRTLDYNRMAAMVRGVSGMLEELARD